MNIMKPRVILRLMPIGKFTLKLSSATHNPLRVLTYMGAMTISGCTGF
jgi:hypothetical protein